MEKWHEERILILGSTYMFSVLGPSNHPDVDDPGIPPGGKRPQPARGNARRREQLQEWLRHAAPAGLRREARR